MPRYGRRYRVSSQDWRRYYDRIKTTPEGAIKKVRRGDRIFVGTACGEPQELVRALIRPESLIEDAEVYHLLSMGATSYSEPHLAGVFRHNSFFIGPATRQAINEGRADYIPIMLSDIPKLFREGRLPLDVALIQVSPPDGHGFCTYGVSVDIVKAAAESAGLVIAQVNPRMPRTLGDSFIHVMDLDAVVEFEEPVLVWQYPETQEIHHRVARNVARLISDGATLQMGIGLIPDAVLTMLKDRIDLGIHTEVFSDGLIDLIECGAVTCAKKSIHPGKIITSFCMGTQRLYDYVDANALFEFHPTDYCNNPAVIAQNDRLTAINVALEVDLTGQVNADSLGFKFFSGIGGQADFIRGAALARRGMPIITLPSTTLDGKYSRIVPSLKEGSGVVTTRGDVHYVATEYGVAYLHGKNVRDRALALIAVAHPDERAALMNFAKGKKYVYPDQMLPPGHGVVYPEALETKFRTRTKGDVFIWPVKPTDENLVREMFYDLSEKTVYLRFFSHLKAMPHEKAQLLVNLDYQEQMAIGAYLGEYPDFKMIGLAQYIRNPNSNMAELAFLVLDDYQKEGLGKFLFQYLVRIARQNGIEGFSAEVLSDNRPMIHILSNCGYKINTRIEDDVYNFIILFEFPEEKELKLEGLRDQHGP
jgi:acyl-CoA hydrolase/GNAT superfamily N-acetyltransferase